MSKPIRIQKYLSQLGVCSRRHAEKYIRQGRITLNGSVVTELGTQITPGQDKLTVDDKPILYKKTKATTVALFKPRDVITSLYDPQNRPIVTDLLPNSLPRLWPIGRLDWASEGLVLMTNDGELTNALTHPSKNIDKTYIVKLQGKLTPKDSGISMMRRGVTLDDGFVTSSCDVVVIRSSNSSTWLQIILHEGHNRQIRRMCEAVGYRVQRLRRISVGNITLEPLSPGQWRPLTTEELVTLYQHASLSIPSLKKAKDIARDMIAAAPRDDEDEPKRSRASKRPPKGKTRPYTNDRHSTSRDDRRTSNRGRYNDRDRDDRDDRRGSDNRGGNSRGRYNDRDDNRGGNSRGRYNDRDDRGGNSNYRGDSNRGHYNDRDRDDRGGNSRGRYNDRDRDDRGGNSRGHYNDRDRDDRGGNSRGRYNDRDRDDRGGNSRGDGNRGRYNDRDRDDRGGSRGSSSRGNSSRGNSGRGSSSRGNNNRGSSGRGNSNDRRGGNNDRRGNNNSRSRGRSSSSRSKR